MPSATESPPSSSSCSSWPPSSAASAASLASCSCQLESSPRLRLAADSSLQSRRRNDAGPGQACACRVCAVLEDVHSPMGSKPRA
eukprot:4721480-Pleurochrysis_carterae.AAC.1